MDALTVGLLGIVVLLLVMFLTRLPVGFSMAVVGFLGYAVVINPSAAMNMVKLTVWEYFTRPGFAVIPLFILMGNVCFVSGVSGRLYRTAYAWLGHIRGGLAMATVTACAGFAAICGSNAATAATMSAVALPEMKKFGYDDALSTGAVASGATLGVVIPPSVVLILIALQAAVLKESELVARLTVENLFFAAVVPGLILTALMLFTVHLVCRIDPTAGPGGPRASWGERMRSLPGAVEMVVLFFAVMTGLFLGWVTPSEAGAAGAFFAIVLALSRRQLTWKRFATAVGDTVRMSCMILVIVTGAVIFGKFLNITRLPFAAADWVSGLAVPPLVILLLMLFIYVVGGAVMDALGLLMITIPIFFPVAVGLGYDPVWFAVVITVVTTLGAITPPVGVNAFVTAAMSEGVNLATVFRGVTWFIPAFLVCIALLILWPELALWAPGLLG